MRLLQQITRAAPEAFYQCVCECEACVNVNLTLPVLPLAIRVCACVNVNLTLPVLSSMEINKQICGTIRKVVACVM